MEYGHRAPAKMLRRVLLPALFSLAWPAANASADNCSLTLLNSVPLTVDDEAAWVTASVGDKEKLFQVDTAALDNQMGRAAMKEFGLTAVDFAPAQTGAGLNIGGAGITDITGASRGFATASDGGPGSDAVPIYNDRGVMFHSMATARPFTLGSMRTDQLQFVVTDLPKPGSGGILSSKFFRHYDVDLNFWGHKLNLFAPSHCKDQVLYWRAPGAGKLPFTYKDGRIIVRVSLDGREMDAAIDTGSPHSEIQDDNVDGMYYLNSRSPGVTREDGVLAHDFSALSFGNVQIFHPHLQLTHSTAMRGSDTGPHTGTLLRNVGPTTAQPELVIGTDLLRLLHVYIAFDERMIYVTQGLELAQGDAKALPVVAVTPFRP